MPPQCKVGDSLVIEPFHSSTAVMDSYSFHSPCEHTLLSTCDLPSQRALRVTVNFAPSNLDLHRLAIQTNNSGIITVSEDGTIESRNIGRPIFTNTTLSLYRSGIAIAAEVGKVKIVLSEFGVKVERRFGAINQVLVEVTEGRSAVNVCGLCGSERGVLVYSDRRREADRLDVRSVEEFAESWRVGPLEQLLGRQGEECGSYGV